MISINNIKMEDISFDTEGNTVIKDRNVNEALKELQGSESRGGLNVTVKLPKNVNVTVFGVQNVTNN